MEYSEYAEEIVCQLSTAAPNEASVRNGAAIAAMNLSRAKDDDEDD